MASWEPTFLKGGGEGSPRSKPDLHIVAQKPELGLAFTGPDPILEIVNARLDGLLCRMEQITDRLEKKRWPS